MCSVCIYTNTHIAIVCVCARVWQCVHIYIYAKEVVVIVCIHVYIYKEKTYMRMDE